MAAKKRGSCGKFMVWSCGCTTLAFVLMIAFGGISYLVTKPGPPDLKPLSNRTILPISSEGENAWANQFNNSTKPVQLILDIAQCNFTMNADGDPGEVKFEGNYDHANFELNTSVEEREDRIVYRVEFQRKSGGNWLWVNDEHNNRISLAMPPKVPVAIDFEGRAMEATLDLTNMPVSDFRSELKAGKIKVMKRDENLIQSEKVQLNTSMGSVRLFDLQNFNTDRVRVETSMGDARIFNSGEFQRGLDVDVNASMGDVVLQVPESTRLKVRQNVSMGAYRGPSILSSDGNMPELNLSVNVSMGSMTLETGMSKPLVSKVLLKVFRQEDLNGALRFYEKLAANDFDGYREEPDALRTFGLALLDLDRPYDGLDVLKRNASNRPADPASFHALAQGYQAIGDFRRAREEIFTALEIDPDYQPAARFLRELDTRQEQPPEL